MSFEYAVRHADLSTAPDWKPHDPWDQHYAQPGFEDRDQELEGYLDSLTNVTNTSFLAALDARYALSRVGMRALSTTTTAQNGVGAGPTTVTNLAATFAQVAGRQVRVSFNLACRQRTAGGVLTLSAYETNVGTGTLLYQELTPVLAIDEYWVFSRWFPHAPAAGSRTYRLQIGTTAGTVDLQVLGANTPGSIMAEDIGPA